MNAMNWLLVRGLTREQRHWGRFRDVLQSQMNGGVVRSIDLPGVGSEIERDSPALMEAIVQDTRERWLKMRDAHPGPWGFFGISLGGMVGMEWVTRYSGDFKALVLMNSSARNLSSPWKRMNFAVLPKLIINSTLKDITERERRILKMTTNLLSEEELNRTAQEWAAVAGDAKRLKLAFKKQLPAAIKFNAPATLPVPTLVLTSVKDRFTDSSCSYKLAEHLKAPLFCHPEAGHDITLDDPQWTTERIAEWMNNAQLSN